MTAMSGTDSGEGRDASASTALLEALLARRKSGGSTFLDGLRNGSGGSDGRSLETREAQEAFAVAGIVLGLVSLALNVLVLVVLVAQRRAAFRHVFYILVLNFCVIDALKGASLIMFSTVKTLDLTSSAAMTLSQQKILVVKIEQITLFILRFCNLGTILNVLMITVNEFLFIKFPLRYNAWIRRRRAVGGILVAWAVDLAFTLATTFARSQKPSFLIGPCVSSSTAVSSAASSVLPGARNSSRSCVFRPPASQSMAVHNIFMFALISFCLFCLLVVLVCYTLTFAVIYRIHRQDAALKAEMDQNAIQRRISELADADARRRASDVSNALQLGGGEPDEKRIKKHIARRYKYVLVIGSVIAVYSLYLVSYTTIQILQYHRLSIKSKTRNSWSSSSFIIQWSLQLLVGLHAVVQPLCYFRIREFRRFANKTAGGPCRPKPNPDGETMSMRSHRPSTSLPPDELLFVSPPQGRSEACESLLGNGAATGREGWRRAEGRPNGSVQPAVDADPKRPRKASVQFSDTLARHDV